MICQILKPLANLLGGHASEALELVYQLLLLEKPICEALPVIGIPLMGGILPTCK